MRRTIVIGVVGLAAALAACGEPAPSTEGGGAAAPVGLPLLGCETVSVLTAPWRAGPLGLDAAMRATIADRCQQDMGGGGKAPMRPVLMDVRGGGVAIVRLSGPGGAIGCDAIHILPDGSATGAGGGWSTDQVEPLPAIGLNDLDNLELGQVMGGNLSVEGWSVRGRAGPAVASVKVEAPGVPVVTATLQDGWFGAWWPVDIPNDGSGAPPLGVVVRAYDLFGNLLSEAKP